MGKESIDDSEYWIRIPFFLNQSSMYRNMHLSRPTCTEYAGERNFIFVANIFHLYFCDKELSQSAKCQCGNSIILKSKTLENLDN